MLKKRNKTILRNLKLKNKYILKLILRIFQKILKYLQIKKW